MQMRKAETGVEAVIDPGFEVLFQQVHHIYKTNSLGTYFRFLDELVDAARKSLSALEEDDKREHLQQQYRQVIEYALDLACENAG